MKSIFYRTIFGLIFTIFCLFSCRKDTDFTTPNHALTLSELKQKFSDSRPVTGDVRLLVSNPTTQLGFLQRLPNYKIDLLAYGQKDNNGYLKSITSTVMYNPNTFGWVRTAYTNGFPSQMETSKGYLIDLTNYNKANNTVDATVKTKADGKVIASQSLTLSAEFFKSVENYQSNASGRLAAPVDICNEETKRAVLITGITVNIFLCSFGFIMTGFGIATAIFTEGLSLLLVPEGFGDMILGCTGAVDGLNDLVGGSPNRVEEYIGPAGNCFVKGVEFQIGSKADCFEDLALHPVSGIITCTATLLGGGSDAYGCGCKNEEKPQPNGRSTGDPHLTTSDNLLYDFQGHGEFIAAKSTVDNFEVQVRQEDVNNTGTITMNTAVAVQTGTDVICVMSKPDQLFINNKPQELSFNSIALKDNASIRLGTDQGLKILDITTKNGDVVRVRFHNSYLLDYLLYLKENHKGKMIGLMGNYDGNAANDLQIQNGSLTQNTFEGLYPVFANSWRIKSEQSLFYYSSGKTTNSYTILDFPKSKAVLALEAMQRAEAVCRNAGIISEPFLSNCIYDVAVTNDNSLASSSLWGQQFDLASTTAALPPSSIITKFIDTKELMATYEVRNGNLLVNFTTTQDLTPAILVDINQNGSMDANLDRSYGSYGTQYPNSICVQYLIDLRTTSYCGVPPSKATQSTDGKTFRYVIPISELKTVSGNTKALILIEAYSPTTNFHYYPAYSNSLLTFFSKTYQLNLN